MVVWECTQLIPRPCVYLTKGLETLKTTHAVNFVQYILHTASDLGHR